MDVLATNNKEEQGKAAWQGLFVYNSKVSATQTPL
jgi:hypothetical protein